VLVRDASGNVVAQKRFASGNMTLEEQALVFLETIWLPIL
jgi:hypothetical protein